jgi:sigma-B regulation protein RsbU (phosphoserine phosphatase)
LTSLLLFGCALMLSSIASAQEGTALDPHRIDAAHIGAPVNINSTWLAHEGDDPGFADPNLDDSRWIEVIAGRPITSYFPYADQLWYRTHVRVAPGSRDLGLQLKTFTGSYQFFVNGAALHTPEPPLAAITDPSHHHDGVVVIPDSLIGNGDLTIAIHGHIQAGYGSGGLGAFPVLLGSAAQLEDSYQLGFFREYGSNFLTMEFNVLLLLTAVSLFLMMRSSSPEYKALVIFVAADIMADCLDVFVEFRAVSQTQVVFLRTFVQIIQYIALIEFFRLVVGLRRSRTVIVYEWAYAVVILICTVCDILTRRGGPAHWLPLIYCSITVRELIALPFRFGLPVLAAWAWVRRRNRDALLLLGPLAVAACYNLATFIPFARMMLERGSSYRGLGPVPIPLFSVQWVEVDDALFLMTLIVFVILRAIRLARSRAALASEIEAAQSVQQLLLARASQPTPGFLVESVYLPAAEVGGDFYVVTPLSDGSLIAVVGDVSGKGLLAAMRVSMILGVLRRESSHDVGAILENLNQALLTQVEMGFTTACCVRLRRDGQFTVSNAGHICPYLHGREVESVPGLPLGLVPDQQYEEIAGQLLSGQKLVLTSDGVVEARNTKGELFGFDRMGLLTLQPAQQIAATAQAFGQEDDITVLTLACTA